MSLLRFKPWTFRSRRIINGALTSLCLLCLAVLVHYQHVNLVRSNYTTGYLLIGCLAFLALFNVRKKLSMLPRIGSASFWMQLHIYVGLSTFGSFALHLGWQIPSGLFERGLAVLYLIVALSGVYGLMITRILPKRLTSLPQEVIYERIPWLRRDLTRQARALVMSACESTDVLARFYINRLANYLECPRGLLYLVNPNGRMRRQMIAEIEELNRFLGEDQRKAGRDLVELVKKKDDLDYHAAIQGRLKGWLFVHIGLTYSLLIVAMVHGILVHAFAR
jgi:hypothetical protein